MSSRVLWTMVARTSRPGGRIRIVSVPDRARVSASTAAVMTRSRISSGAVSRAWSSSRTTSTPRVRAERASAAMCGTARVGARNVSRR